MKSHSYDLKASDWSKLLLGPLLAFVSLVGLAHLFLHFGWQSRGVASALTIDDVILEEKQRLCRSRSSADTVLIGDSSCLMDVSFVQLSQVCPGLHYNNLGTLSTLGLPRFRELLQSYLRSQGPGDEARPVAASDDSPASFRPGLKRVILLISPEMVRTAEQPVVRTRSASQEKRKRQLLAPQKHESKIFDPARWLATFYKVTAVSRLRSDVADALLEAPLPGPWGQLYGCLSGFRQHLVLNSGCAIDPSDRAEGPIALPLKSADLSPTLRAQCEEFGRILPPGVQLAVGLTPIPQSEAVLGYRDLYGKVVGQLKDALHADVGLTNLPPTLPDHYFSTSTHLSEMGARQFSHDLGRALRQVVTSEPPVASGR